MPTTQKKESNNETPRQIVELQHMRLSMILDFIESQRIQVQARLNELENQYAYLKEQLAQNP